MGSLAAAVLPVRAIKLGLLALACGNIEHHPIATDKVDWLELNWVYDSRGVQQFPQYIGWDFEGWTKDFHCQWWLIPDCKERFPMPVQTEHGWELLIHKRDKLYRIQADSFSQTWTQWDREVIDREQWPVDWRKGLP